MCPCVPTAVKCFHCSVFSERHFWTAPLSSANCKLPERWSLAQGVAVWRGIRVTHPTPERKEAAGWLIIPPSRTA